MKTKKYLSRLLTAVSAGVIALSFSAGTSPAQEQEAVKANFKLANRFAPVQIRKLIYDTSVRPNWIKGTDSFWYSYKTAAGTSFYLVDPVKKTKKPVFSNAEIAAQLSEALKKPYDAEHLPIKRIEFDKNLTKITFTVEKTEFDFSLTSQKITRQDSVRKKERKPRWANFSPDSSTILFARNHNLYMMKANNSDSVEIQMTTDGERFYSYAGNSADTSKTVRQRVWARWSKDSKKFFLTRYDERQVKDLYLLNVLHKPRPELDSYKYAMPGEENVTQYELHVFDRETKKQVLVKADKWKDQTLTYSRWGKGSDVLYFIRVDRPMHKVDVCRADAETGEVSVLLKERMDTYIELESIRLLNDDSEFIWWSERDGWAHFYLYNMDGKLKNRITSGPFSCRNAVKIDTAARALYFTATGKEKNVSPYLTYLYRVNFDGTGLKLLTPEHADHSVRFSPEGNYFTDTYSLVDQIPQSIVKNGAGMKLLTLETADVTRLEDAGWKPPERITIKAGDGVTDLYGVMWKPFNFDSTRKYPVITYVYPGPQTEAFPTSFNPDNINTGLSQLGFIVVCFGNRGGSPLRSKWYHNYGYGNLRDYGLEDKKVGIENLALRYPWIDTDKVGIYGASGGGFMTAAAMLVYPDFFKVGVAWAGNHDNNIYNRWWSEKHHGVKEVTKKDKKDQTEKIEFESTVPTNPAIAKNLKGHILLMHGLRDNNVHPTNTFRLADAFVKSNKYFDMMIIPDEQHRLSIAKYQPYILQVIWRYFAGHLLGDFRYSVDIYDY